MREHLGPYLAIDLHTIGLNAASACWVDAREFEAAVDDERAAKPEALRSAMALYRADFLEGFYVREAPEFEAWMLAQRTRLRELMLQRLARLAQSYAAQGDLAEAINTVQRLLELEPWREEAHRQVMAWLLQSGRRNAALLQYDLCKQALAEELGVEPEQATRELYAQLLRQDAEELAAEAVTQPAAKAVTAVEFVLVGRQAEWQMLRTGWAKALQGDAHLVCIEGEAGIGKTRLAEELLVYVERQGHATAHARAYALEGRLAYAPIAGWLRSPALQAPLAKLNPVWLQEVARLMPELLIGRPDLTAPPPLANREQQRRLYEAMQQAFIATGKPLLLVLDDLQWCDTETLAWLQYAIEAAQSLPLLVVGTVRSDEVGGGHPLHNLRRMLLRAGKLTTVELQPLSAAETAVLGGQVADAELELDAVAQLFQATAGNPLFVVETARAGFKAPKRAGDSAPRTNGSAPEAASPGAGLPMLPALPPKVLAVIEGRLAQLSPIARSLCQWAATIGRASTLRLLMQASRHEEELVVDALDELWQRRILREQGIGRFDFAHDRIRDVAYAEISPAKRGLLHRRVAQAIEALEGADLDTVAGELGLHYQRAEAWAEALRCYRQAALVARRLYAHNEVVDYLQRAIAAAQMLPPDRETRSILHDLWIDLGQAQVVVHDWGSELVETAWRKADEVAEQNNDRVGRCGALCSLSIVYRNRGEWRRAWEVNTLGITLAAGVEDPAIAGHIAADCGITLFHQGRFGEALAGLRRHPLASPIPGQLTFAREGRHLSPGVFVRTAKCLWMLGYPDQALTYGRHVLALRNTSIDFLGRFPALTFAGMLFSFALDVATVRMLGEELTEISLKYDFPLFATEGRMLLGWALAQMGEVERGLALLQQANEDHRRRNSRMFEPYYRSLLAEAYALAGQWEEALDEVAGAYEYAEECGNRYWNAQLLKLQGDYLQALRLEAGEVEDAYRRAIATAQGQGAKSLELRATTALARFYQQQGRRAEACGMLQAIYGQFTEGFSTTDLQEAAALLEELRGDGAVSSLPPSERAGSRHTSAEQ